MLAWIQFSPRSRSRAPARRSINTAVGRALERLEGRLLLTADTLTVTGLGQIDVVAGRVAQGPVATITDSNPFLHAADFDALINWGDGTVTQGRVVEQQSGQFQVTGRHSYSAAGPRAITVTVRDPFGNTATDGSYLQTPLVSDQPGQAPNLDPNLVNPWGLASNPTGPFWVADNGAGVATLYNGEGVPQSLVVTIPGPPGSESSSPTGIVFNDTTDFATTAGPSHFIFATEDGTIAAWSAGTEATLEADNSASGAIYKGLALGAVGESNFLYATNFHSGKIDVFDTDFNQVQIPNRLFNDPKIPPGFAPFGIQNVNGVLVVTYAKQDAAKEDDVPGPGNGFIAAFTTDGRLIATVAARGPLNSPWAVTLAPSDFGQFSNAALVSNFGDGRINAFDPRTGKFLGQMTDAAAAPIEAEGLWGLKFGNGGSAGQTDQLFFTAGVDDEQHGLFGNLTAVGQPTIANVRARP